MPAGWAGHQAPESKLKCAVCILRDNRLVDPVTEIGGTLVCLQHARWIPLPLSPGNES